jgi:putative transposase
MRHSENGSVEHYIANQARHQRQFSFENEFVALLKKYGIPFDPGFVFG